jgi:nucleoporin NDC1
MCTLTSARVQSCWARPRPARVAEASLSRRDIDASIARGAPPLSSCAADANHRTPALSHLLGASLTEDQYGVAQRDIPRVVEALLAYLAAVDAFAAEVGRRRGRGGIETFVYVV